MAITGVQLIYRLRETVRLLVDYRIGVDSFNIYWSNASGGPYTLFNNFENVPIPQGSFKNRIPFEFNVGPLGLNWNNTITNYIKIAPVTGGVEGALEGPLIVPAKFEKSKYAATKSSLVVGYYEAEERYVPVAVDSVGKVRITNV